ncbi:unnamed protein product [Oncorhynchus mykiss]|uniref:Fibronectin type-III domain-containing protein n=1 Tax=Oncorhynchus mykiss TaxID=8022 RepID=A0A060ZF28_ONCMY|nr:unnamed protein product [Oncorhynchus mykiss]
MERVSGNIVEFEMSSLTPATHYTVKVYAMRASAKSAVTTTEFTTDVDAPQGLAASNIQTENAMLTWKAPRAGITGYILSFESADGTIREVVLSPTATSYNMAQLSASTEYSVRLQAIAGPKRSRVITTVFTTSECVTIVMLESSGSSADSGPNIPSSNRVMDPASAPTLCFPLNMSPRLSLSINAKI